MTEEFSPRSRGVPEYVIEIDGIEYPWSMRDIHVAELRELAEIASNVPLVELDSDNNARRLAEDEIIAHPGLVRFEATRRPLTAQSRAQLPRLWLFDGVPATDLEPLLGAAREQRYLPGEVLFREGDEPDGVYVIASGTIRVATTNEHGEALLATVTGDDVLGEMGVLDGQPRSGTASAVEPSGAYFLPAEPFLDVLERSTAVCLRMLVLLTNRLRVSNGRLGELRATRVVAPGHPSDDSTSA